MPLKSKTAHLWRFSVTWNNKTYLGLVFFPILNQILVFLGRFSCKPAVYNFMKIRAVGSCADTCGRTDLKKVMGGFRDDANAPKKNEVVYKERNFVNV